MDRELAPEYVSQSRRKKTGLILVVLAGLLAVGIGFRRLLTTSVDAGKIRSAVAEIGAVENTLSATGEVMPAYEQIITSPIQASIKRVLLTPGTRVRAGQPILELDKSLPQIEYDKINDQLALRQNGIDQLRLKLDKDLADADLNDQIKSLNINKLQATRPHEPSLYRSAGPAADRTVCAKPAIFGLRGQGR